MVITAFKYVPQSEATTFAFSSEVSILAEENIMNKVIIYVCCAELIILGGGVGSESRS